MISEKIGSLLLGKGKIGADELSLSMAVQEVLNQHEPLGNILQYYHFVDEESLVDVLSQQSGWPVYQGSFDIDFDAAFILGVDFLEKKHVIPIKEPDGLLMVMSDPYDTRTSDHLLGVFGKVGFAIAGMRAIRNAIHIINREESSKKDMAGIEGVSDAASTLLDEAVRMGATDIHIEPSFKAVEVRVRIDGVLQFYRTFSLKEHMRLVNIFFHRAEISAGDILKFHDARFDHTFGAHMVDVRLSHIPSIHGSSLVLRLLDKTRSILSLEELGYALEHLRVIKLMLSKPYGILLLTGPTGCGKTTSLYAMLKTMKGISTKVVSVEDPVEMKMPLVTQVPVDIKKGHDFDQVARAFLRHDPDIILIGEIRDAKTAKEAVRAAITGHRVLSTLHTHDAVGAILRLHDLGVDYSLIANTLNGVVSQRLVRKLCPHCCHEEFLTPHSVGQIAGKYIGSPGEIIHVPHLAGCGCCSGGYKGRTLIAETLMVDDQMRFMIEQGLINELIIKARSRYAEGGFVGDAKRLVKDGVISLDEAVRVVG